LTLRFDGASSDGRQLRLVCAGVTIEAGQCSVLGRMGIFNFVQHALASCLHGSNDLIWCTRGDGGKK
jgi:hypothetical protein